MGIQYKPEIDGLRAVAVLAVVSFHAGLSAAGYVGVDVFFVISGYLITSILLEEHARTGSIDLRAFYARRVRRIVPAATVVVLAVLAFAWMLPDREAPQESARSAAASLVFLSNVYFEITTGGYWDHAAEEMPLLHLWSLSVEEQFYLLWPALLLFTRSRIAIGVLALASLGLAEYWMATNPEAAFFRMPARFWELAAGALLAMYPLRLPRFASVVGLALILIECVRPMPTFPGIAALPAVIGAMLVIAGGANRFLASRTMVFIGLVSYSLYLWHWPLLAFYKANGGLEPAMRWTLCVLAFVLAILSWRFVEQPLRRMRFPSGRTVLAGASLSLVFALVACAVSLHEPAPPPAGTKEALAENARNDHLSRKCEYTAGDSVPKCMPLVANDVAFWGDSLALAWSAAIPGSATYSFAGCAPMLDRKGGRFGCRDFNEQVAQHLQVDTLYLVARWEVYSAFDIAPTLEAARGVRRIVVIGPTPYMQDEAWNCIRGDTRCGVTRAEFERDNAPILARLRAQARPWPNVEVWDMANDFCGGDCPVVRDGVAQYYDINHPSITQVRRVFAQRR